MTLCGYGDRWDAEDDFIPIGGDPVVIKSFVGRWYDWGGTQRVRVDRQGRMWFQFPGNLEGISLGPAWTEGDQIHYKVRGEEYASTMTLRLRDGYINIVRLGREPWCGTCNPGYFRFGPGDLAIRRFWKYAGMLTNGVIEGVLAVGDWLIDVT